MANGLFNLKQVMQAVQQGGWPAQKTPAVEYLVVAGGGGGGYYAGAGGGGGGLLTGIDPVPNGQTLLVTVGGGGPTYTGGGGSGTNNPGTNGGNSVFGAITALGGGGGGGGLPGTGLAGGSGGGASKYSSSSTGVGGQGTFGQGNAGGSTGATIQGCGGGGAGTIGLSGAGNTAANGGAGIASSISGTVTAYAGGGAGYPSGTGGVGGGGNYNVSGTSNTGGGAGGDGSTAGGSGIVTVSYPDVYAAATATTGSPTVSTSGSGSFLQVSSSTGWGFAGQTPFVFGTGDFTIELWTYVTDFSYYPTFADFRSAGSTGNGPNLYCNNGGTLLYDTNGTTQISGSTLSTNTWYHIALCRIGTATKLYLNGTQVGSTYTDTTNYVCGSTGPHILINCNSNSGSVVGNTTNIRIVKGVGVYTGTFTPSTVPLQATQPAGTNIAAITGTSTSLLLNSVSGAFAVDASTNAFTSSAANVIRPPVWSALSPFATGLGYKNRVYTWTSSGSITF